MDVQQWEAMSAKELVGFVQQLHPRGLLAEAITYQGEDLVEV